MAESSFLSYTPKDFIETQIIQAGIKSFRFFESLKCKCFVANTSEYVIVAFRGTATKSTDLFIDLIADINIKLTDYEEKGKVHSGFYGAFKDIWNSYTGLPRYLMNLKKKHPLIKFWFTGHSLGAAVAELAANSFKNCHALYTFGAPKVGNADYVNNLKFRSYRVVNYHDPITLLPPTLPKKDKEKEGPAYTHYGKIKFINKEGELRDQREFPENKFTKSITLTSSVIDIVFDNNMSALSKIIHINNKNHKEKSDLSPVTGISVTMNKFKRMILKSKNLNINNHAPVYYAVNLWNIYIKSNNSSN